MALDEQPQPTDLDVPLFPLPNVVHFPHTLLPLHIFEERYKAMTKYALEGDQHIAMALLRDGWQQDYHGRPRVYPTVCVGRIVEHEELPDGRFNFLLLGEWRGTITAETLAGPSGAEFRLATVERVVEPGVLEIDFDEQRKKVERLLDSIRSAAPDLVAQLQKLLQSTMTTPALCDVLAFHVVEPLQAKRELLADGNPHQRVASVVRALSKLSTTLQLRAGRADLN